MSSLHNIHILNKASDEPTLRMFILSAVVALPGLLAGVAMDFPAISLNQLNFSMSDKSWFTSCSDFVAPIGILSQGIIVDAFGRKTAILANIVPHIIGWFLIYCNFGVVVTILGRALTGLSTPSMYYAAQLYVVECITVNHTYLSNNFRTWTALLSSVGMLFTFTLGSCFSYQQVAFGTGVLSLCIFLVVYIYIPESPAWLYLNGRIGDAEMAELKLRISQPLLQYTSTERPRTSSFTFSWHEVEEIIRKLNRPEVCKAVITCTILTTLIMLSGGSILLGYLDNIINESPSGISTSHAAILNTTGENIPDTSSSFSFSISLIFGCTMVFCHIFVTFSLPVLGIRILMIAGVLLNTFGWILIGYTSLQLKSPFLHMASIWMTIFGFQTGTVAAFISILSDLFPIDMKGAASIPILTLVLTSAVSLKLYPSIHAIVGGYVYYVYAFVSMALAYFVYDRLPETVGKSYAQICAKL